MTTTDGQAPAVASSAPSTPSPAAPSAKQAATLPALPVAWLTHELLALVRAELARLWPKAP